MKSEAKLKNQPVSTQTEVSGNERVRRVFQSLEFEEDPITGKIKWNGYSQIVTYVSFGYVDPVLHLVKPPQALVIDRNSAGQFVLPANARYYDEQLTALRNICQKFPDKLQEVSFDKENVPVIKRERVVSVSEAKLNELYEKIEKDTAERHQLAQTLEEKEKEIEALKKVLEKANK